MEKLHYTTFNTDMGWVGVLASPKGLLSVIFPQPTDAIAHRVLGSRIDNTHRAPELFRDLPDRLRAYFSGQMVTFPDDLDLSNATNFQRLVWETTRLIPYGKTRSYAWVALQMKKPGAARAIGQALGRNPLPIIVPCHRVIASNGGLCGFGGGLGLKMHLLQIEDSNYH